MLSPSPPSKRVKLDLSPSQDELHGEGEIVVARHENEDVEVQDGNDESSEQDFDQCSICLQPIIDRTVVPTCSHEFCFECLLVWTGQSRRCPLCAQNIGEYLIHNIRSKYDFQKHYLPPLPTSPKVRPLQPRLLPGGRPTGSVQGRRGRGDREWGRSERRERERQLEAVDATERAVEKRKWIYRHRLYAKHVASNPYTRYRQFPTPAQFAANPDLITRATIFIRRELRVWGCLDVEFLTTFTISLMKSLDIRSESAVKLLSEFLDLDTEHELQVNGRGGSSRANAEHFAHELYCYLRSPYRDLAVYDSVVQYDTPEGIPPPHGTRRSRRWRSRSQSNSRSRSRHRFEPRHHSNEPTTSRVPLEETSSRSSPYAQLSTNSNHPLPHSSLESGPGDRPTPTPLPSYRDQDVSASDQYSDQNDRHDVSRAVNQLTIGGKDVKGKSRAVDPDRTLSRKETGHREHPALISDKDDTSDDRLKHLATLESTTMESQIVGPVGDIDPEVQGPTAEAEDARNSIKSTRPRVTRSVLDSVQIHLSNISTARTKTNRKAERFASEDTEVERPIELTIRGASSAASMRGILEVKDPVMGPNAAAENHNNAAHPGSSTPSLLQRLSDPFDSSTSNGGAVRYTNSTPVSNNDILAAGRESFTDEFDPKGKGSIKMSAPDIMARTRARLARIRAGFVPPSNSTVEHAVDRAISNHVRAPHDASTRETPAADSTSLRPGPAIFPISIPFDPSSSSMKPPPSSSSSSTINSRAKLLSKLEEEKRLYQREPQAKESRASTSSAPPPNPPVDTPGLAPPVAKNPPKTKAPDPYPSGWSDPEMKEATLRSQAQLRVRLAAARRIAVGNAMGSSGSGVGE